VDNSDIIWASSEQCWLKSKSSLAWRAQPLPVFTDNNCCNFYRILRNREPTISKCTCAL